MSIHSHKKSQVKDTWQIQEAKAHFSKLINSLELNGLQKITKQGEEVAIVMSIKEYEKLVRPKTTLIEFFENSPLGEIDIDIQRSKDEMRDIDL
jgi:antitoxin Phd